jgi:hypothetical protein
LISQRISPALDDGYLTYNSVITHAVREWKKQAIAAIAKAEGPNMMYFWFFYLPMMTWWLPDKKKDEGTS